MSDQLPAAISEDAMIHRDLYDKINSNTNAVAALTAEVGVLTRQNERFFELIEKKDANFVKTIRWFVALLALIVAALLAALIYGAIGADGLKAVRESVPMPSHHTQGEYPMAWNDDLHNFKHNNTTNTKG